MVTGIIMTDQIETDEASEEAPNYGTGSHVAAADAKLAFAQLEDLVGQELVASDAVILAEANLEAAKLKLKNLVEREIPDHMVTMRLSECKLADKTKITIDRKIRASLPALKDDPTKRAAAIEWLAANGHGGVIKNHVGVDLSRGEDARADELRVELEARGFEVEAVKDVHHTTLSKLVRELLEDGAEVPRDKINVFDQKIAKITRDMTGRG
jgi:hypothetical protein